MSVLFTEHALDRLKTIALEPEERQQLGDLLSAVDAASGPADLTAIFPGIVSIDKGKRGTMLLVPLGEFRAVVTIEPTHPDRMVVGSLYRADQEDAVTAKPQEAATV
jgi:hypothetical protein